MAKSLRILTDPNFTTRANELTFAQLDENFIDLSAKGGDGFVQLSDGNGNPSFVSGFKWDKLNNKLEIIGSGSTAATTNLTITDSSSNSLIQIRDDGTINMTTTKGAMAVPRVTTTQRDSNISSLLTGMLIYNTTDEEFQGYNGTTWDSIGSAKATGTTGAVLFTDGNENIFSDGANFNWDNNSKEININDGLDNVVISSIGKNTLDSNNVLIKSVMSGTGGGRNNIVAIDSTLTVAGGGLNNIIAIKSIVTENNTISIGSNSTASNIRIGSNSNSGGQIQIGGQIGLGTGKLALGENISSVGSGTSNNLFVIGRDITSSQIVNGLSNCFVFGQTDKALTLHGVNKNLFLGNASPQTTNYDISETNTFHIQNGINPNTTPENTFALYSKDFFGANTASPYFLTEDGVEISVREIATENIYLEYNPNIITVGYFPIYGAKNSLIFDWTDTTQITQIQVDYKLTTATTYTFGDTLTAPGTASNTLLALTGANYEIRVSVIFEATWNDRAFVKASFA